PARLVEDNPIDLAALLETVPAPVLLLVDGAHPIPDVLRSRVTWNLVLDPAYDDPDLRISDDGSLICAGSRGPLRANRCSEPELEAVCRAAARSAGRNRTDADRVTVVDEPMRPILGATEHGALHLDLRESG